MKKPQTEIPQMEMSQMKIPQMKIARTKIPILPRRVFAKSFRQYHWEAIPFDPQ